MQQRRAQRFKHGEPLGIFQVTEDGRIHRVNRAAARLFGWDSRREFLEHSPHVTDCVDSIQLERVKRQLMSSQSAEDFVLLAHCKDGGKSKWLRLNIWVRELKHSKVRYEGTAEELENTSTVAQFGGAPNLNLLGEQFSSELNNILALISGCAQAMDRDLPETSNMRRKLQLIDQAVERATSLSRQITLITTRNVLDLNSVIRRMGRLIRRAMGQEVKVKLKLDKTLWDVRADPVQISRALMHICTKALQVTPRGGTLVLRTENVTLEPQCDAALRDLGSGMFARAIFSVVEPRTHRIPSPEEIVAHPSPSGSISGTLDGMSAIFDMVEKSGGTLRINRKSGESPRFELYFPKNEVGFRTQEELYPTST